MLTKATMKRGPNKEKQYNYCNLALKVKITPFVCSYNLLYNACIRESDWFPNWINNVSCVWYSG